MEDELRYRLRAIQRATQLRAGALPPGDASRLRDFCDSVALTAD